VLLLLLRGWCTTPLAAQAAAEGLLLAATGCPCSTQLAVLLRRCARRGRTGSHIAGLCCRAHRRSLQQLFECTQPLHLLLQGIQPWPLSIRHLHGCIRCLPRCFIQVLLAVHTVGVGHAMTAHGAAYRLLLLLRGSLPAARWWVLCESSTWHGSPARLAALLLNQALQIETLKESILLICIHVAALCTTTAAADRRARLLMLMLALLLWRRPWLVNRGRLCHSTPARVHRRPAHRVETTSVNPMPTLVSGGAHRHRLPV